MWQKIKNIYHLARAILASIYFGFPSKKLTVIGVTGTDGKTTTAHMIYEILKSADKKVSIISSIYAVIGEKNYDTGFHVTTPDPVALQRFMRKMVNEKTQYFILEVTSHALDQNRVAQINFKVGVLTNISHEHLDYHKNFKNYLMAKSKLFKNTKISILNIDDNSFEKIAKIAGGRVVTYGINKKAQFSLKEFPVKLKISGDYNLHNALAAAAAASQLRVDKTTIISSLSNFQGLTGRMESIDLGQDFKVIIDFAHTPNALENALKTFQKLTKKRVITVFGCAGLRDKIKRPLMGKIAAENSDISVITAEDPRTEKAEDICYQIAQGFGQRGKKEHKDYYIITDRKEAIQFAINLARNGDIVATFGKSHEKSMCFGKKEYPWDEFLEVKRAIKKRLKHEK